MVDEADREVRDDFIHDPPADQPAADGATWQERAYFSLHRSDGVALDIGCGRHPSGDKGPGTYSAYACLGSGGAQTNVRAAGPLSRRLGVPQPGPFSFEILEPLRRWRIGLDSPALGVDLTFEAGSTMWALPRTRIVGGRGTTVSSQICFQAGTYNGHIDHAEERIEVVDWPGLRDRTWGYRSFEGRLPSGLMVAAMFSMDDHGLMLWSVERRTGERVVANGARLLSDGTVREVLDWKFDFEFGGPGRFERADLSVTDETGTERYVLTSAGSTIYLAGGGYLAEGRHGEGAAEASVAAETWDTGDEDLLARITGLDDHVVAISGDRQGSGVLEIQLGKHERYRPEGWADLSERVGQAGGA